MTWRINPEITPVPSERFDMSPNQRQLTINGLSHTVLIAVITAIAISITNKGCGSTGCGQYQAAWQSREEAAVESERVDKAFEINTKEHTDINVKLGTIDGQLKIIQGQNSDILKAVTRRKDNR